MPFALAAGFIVVAALVVSVLDGTMAREGEAFKAAEAEALARGEVPERWRGQRDPSDAAVAVEFPEGAQAQPPNPEPRAVVEAGDTPGGHYRRGHYRRGHYWRRHYRRGHYRRGHYWRGHYWRSGRERA